MRRHPAVYLAEDVDRYCPDTEVAKVATGLDVPAAIAQVRRILEKWPDAPKPAQRRHLAALFLAAGDPASALVQWWQRSEEHTSELQSLMSISYAVFCLK